MNSHYTTGKSTDFRSNLNSPRSSPETSLNMSPSKLGRPDTGRS